jgi:hypothetical protein
MRYLMEEGMRDVPGSELDLVITLNYVDVQFSFGRGDEDSLVDLELCRRKAVFSPLAYARGTRWRGEIDKEVEE